MHKVCYTTNREKEKNKKFSKKTLDNVPLLCYNGHGTLKLVSRG